MAVVSSAEHAAAAAFLKEIGANSHNLYLVAAVTAWLHAESGGLRNVIGNNPFNIRPTRWDARWRIGSRKGRVGYFSVYRSIDDGFRATASLLIHLPNYYANVVKALRKGDALGFLKALAMSPWDAGHYHLTWTMKWQRVYDPAKDAVVLKWVKVYDWSSVSLLRIFYSFTAVMGLPITPPRVPSTPTPQPPPVQPPTKPKPVRLPVNPPTLKPHERGESFKHRRWYERRPGTEVRTDDGS